MYQNEPVDVSLLLYLEMVMILSLQSWHNHRSSDDSNSLFHLNHNLVKFLLEFFCNFFNFKL